MQKWRIWLMLAPALSVVLLLFGGGLFLAVLQSFGYLPIIGQTELSLDAYRAIFSDSSFYQSLGFTLWISVASTAISVVLAIACALALQHSRARWLTFLFQLNIPIPHLVGAIGILLLFSQSGLLARLAFGVGLIEDSAEFPALVFDRYGIGIMLEYIWKETCFIGLVVLATLRSLGDDYVNAARTLGANHWQRLRHITLPLIMPSVLSASVLVFTFAFGSFEVPLLLGQRFPSALPVVAWRTYTSIDLTRRPEAMALAVLISLFITVFVFFYVRLVRQLSAETR